MSNVTQFPAKQSDTLPLQFTWAAALPMLIEIRQRAETREARKLADTELARLAKMADELLPALVDALRATTAYTELDTGNGCRKQPPAWAILENGDFDPEKIATAGREALAMYEELAGRG